MSNMDQSYLIELDANISPTILIKQLMDRLDVFIIRKATKSLRLNDPVEVQSDEDGVVQQLEPIDAEELMQSVTVQARISPKFKWRRSKWLKYCPVSLRNGSIVDGRPEYAAT
jgi:adenylate/nucleoside-diphosphate kinase